MVLWIPWVPFLFHVCLFPFPSHALFDVLCLSLCLYLWSSFCLYPPYLYICLYLCLVVDPPWNLYLYACPCLVHGAFPFHLLHKISTNDIQMQFNNICESMYVHFESDINNTNEK